MNKLLFKLPIVWRLVAAYGDINTYNRLCKVAKIHPQLYVWKKKTDKIAWANKYGVIITQDTLESFTDKEIKFILAHELGHHALGHVGTQGPTHEEDANQYAVELVKRLDNVTQ